MTFLSGESIEKRLNAEPAVIIKKDNESETNFFDKNSIDCNSYRLSVGPEVLVTDGNTNSPNITTLTYNESFKIPSGQFAYILTEEIVHLPKDLMGFISISSKIKFKGLINVSGFHVDPGWKGRLIFAVYNAGPLDILMRRNDKIFNIWFSKIDNDNSNFIKINNDPYQYKISSEFMNYLNGNIHSPQTLNRKIENLETKYKWTLAGIILSFAIGFGIGIGNDFANSYFDFSRGYKKELQKYSIRPAIDTLVI